MFPDNEICTRRLRLVAATEQHVRAELNSLEEFCTLLDAEVPPGWPPGQYDREAQEFFLQSLIDGGKSAIGWFGWYAIHATDKPARPTLIGCGGYFGPPSRSGIVEIGYSVCSEWTGHGFATEMAKALAERAIRLPTVRRVIAHAHKDNQTSLAVLHRSGFVQVFPSDQPGALLFQWQDVMCASL